MSLIYNASFDSATRVLSLLDKAGNVISSCEVPSKSNELTLTATADNSSVKLTKTGTVNNTYEVNTGSGWGSYTFGTVINLNKGQSCKWRCTSHPTSFSYNKYVQFVMKGSIEASGEVYSMLSSNLSDVTTLDGYDYAFDSLFKNCTSLTKAPELPATTLTSCCYASMFYGCTSLTEAPELPATTLTSSCYASMFYGCSNLSDVRIAMNTTANNALYEWLHGVSASGNFYADPSTTFSSGSYGIPVGWDRLVYGATETGTTTLYRNGSAETVRVGTSSYGACYALQGWAGFKTLAQMHALGYTLSPQTSVTVYYYEDAVFAYSVSANVDDNFTETMYDVGNGMGYLTIAQLNNLGYYLVSTAFTGLTLTATVNNSSVQLNKVGTGFDRSFKVNTGNGWSDYTFGTVINLNSGQFCQWARSDNSTTSQDYSKYVRFAMTGTIEASGNCNSMLSGGFANITSLNGHSYAFYNLFSSCTSLTRAPQLPATTLAYSCYSYMFDGCTSLVQAPQLPATTGASSCYYSMFKGCTALTQAPSISLTVDADCSSMFKGCTSLTVAPDLPATSGTYTRYTSMFEGCTSLTTPPMISLTDMSDSTCESMFKGCTSLTYSPKLPVKSLKRHSYYEMFYGCSNLSEVGCGATRVSGQYDYCLEEWLRNVAPTGLLYCDPTSEIFKPDSEDGIPENWKRLTFVDDAVDTGTTATMYHNGVTETVRVGTSVKYGNCYIVPGGHFFNTLSDIHKLGYSFGAPTTVTLYRFEEPISAYCVAANVDDDISAPLYDTGDGNGLLTIEQQNERGVYIASKVFTGLTLTATSNDSSVKLTNEYSYSKVPNRFMVNSGSGWQPYAEGTLINLSIGQTCQWYCCEFNQTQISSIHYYSGKNVKFTMTGTIEASGNCNSMLSGNFDGITSLSRYEAAFGSLFAGCKSLTKAPEIPATTLKTSCYERMFAGCTSLTKAPELPATELDTYCYEEMFKGCTALVQPPVLPVTTLKSYCYSSMFRDCTSLTRSPELPATTLPHACYYNMFNGCTSLAEVRIAATTKEPKSQYVLDNWLSNVSATGDFYCDPSATIFPTDSASGIPANWTRRNIADYPVTP